MSLNSVLSAIEWWTPSSTWGGGYVNQASQVERVQIESLISDLYNSSPNVARPFLETMSATTIRLGYTSQGSLTHNIDPRSSAINPDQSFLFINKFGTVSENDMSLVVFHELYHQATGELDPQASGSVAAENDPNYSLIGTVQNATNNVALDMGQRNQYSVNYALHYDYATADGLGWALGKSYTFSSEIDTARVGTSGSDMMTMSGRGISRDLMFADLGDDTVYGGSGNDFVYGDSDPSVIMGGGNDVLYLGDGGDLGFGAQGSDTIRGENGDDTIQGESGDDVLLGGAGDDTLLGDASSLDQGPEGSDTLHGGDGDDFIAGNGGKMTFFLADLVQIP